MAKYRIVHTDFWQNPIVLEEMTPEDRYFYLYLLTNPHTTQIGIYKITKKQIAFDLGYTLESVQLLMERFFLHHKLIRYNPETRELAIKDWGKFNLHKGGKPVMDCIASELKDVEDLSLIHYVSDTIDYSHEILPPLPYFLPISAKEFTAHCQGIYQWMKKAYRLRIY